MALQRTVLENQYKAYFSEVNKREEHITIARSADRWLQPYDQYAKTGQDPSGDQLIAGKYGLAKKVFIQGLIQRHGEQAFKDALSVYWMGASFGIVIPHPTMSQEFTSLVTGLSTAPLNGIFRQNYEDIDEAVENVVSRLEAFTKTIQILITGLAKAGSPPPTITAAGKLT